MSLLGVELSDAGILVAGSQPAQLLETDQSANSSPGYALPQKKQNEQQQRLEKDYRSYLNSSRRIMRSWMEQEEFSSLYVRF